MRDWIARMRRIETAELLAIAFHEPKKLGNERRSAIAEARALPDDDDIRRRGQEIARAIERGNVMVS